MRLPTVPNSLVVDHLNSVYFNRLWNLPDNNSRANFQLFKAAERIATGVIPIGLSVVGLPTTDAVYAVYKTGIRSFGRFMTLPANTWIRNDQNLTDYAITLTAYTSAGRVIPGDQIFLYYIPTRNMVLVAVSVSYTKACAGMSYPDLWMTLYRDATRNTSITSNTYLAKSPLNSGVTVAAIASAITLARTNYPKGTTVAVNGWIYDPLQVPVINPGDVVVVTSDPDIVGYCDITVDDNVTGYYSQKYGEYRELLHIPKAINPNNIIITNDTISLVVFDTATNRGVFGHRADSHALESVTHNDFSMSRSVIQAFSEQLGAQNVKVRMYVRFTTQPNPLTDDVNHLIDLYALSDAEIQSRMLGLTQPDIRQWHASHLEQSKFIDLLYTFNEIPASQAIDTFSQACGYYDVAFVLGQQMRYYTYQGAEVYITKPARLIGYDCEAMVYCNGRKILEWNYDLTNYSDKYITLGFRESADVNVGDRIAVYIVESGYRTPVPYSPTAAAPSITVENEDFTLVEVTRYTTPVPVWDGSTSAGYKPLALGPSDYTVTLNSDGTAVFQVKSKHYGKEFELYPKYGLGSAVYPIDQLVITSQPIIIELTINDLVGAAVPAVAYNAMEVYLNGYRLIEGIDYKTNLSTDNNGFVLQNLLAISNYDYFTPGSSRNTVEVIYHGDTVVSQQTGYAIENKLFRGTTPVMWARSSGRTYVHGVLVEKVSEVGNTMATLVDVENGAPFLIEVNQAFGASKLLQNSSYTDDLAFLNQINNVLGIVQPDYPSTIEISHLLALYSPFLAKITKDVADGILTIVDEPTDDRFIGQFSAYKPLLQCDPTVGNANPRIDRRFVTIAAHYVNFTVTDPNQMLRLQRLISLVLTPADAALLEVLI